MRALCFVIATLCRAWAQPEPACSLSGTVLDAATHRPLANSRVQVQPHQARNGTVIQHVTGEAGLFCFQNLPPGSYRVSVEHSGYQDFVYGATQQSLEGLAMVVQRTAPAPPLTLEMAARAVISGMVVDADGDPVANARVSLMGQKRPSSDRHSETVDMSFTDDRGLFRLAFMKAGTYYLQVSSNARHGMHTDALVTLDEQGQPTHRRAVPTFYNGSLSLQGATPLTVKAGQEITGLVLIQITQTNDRVISGRVATDLFPAGTHPQVNARPQEGEGGESFSARVETDGKFAIADLPPGRYRLDLWGSNGPISVPPLSVDVTGGNVSDVLFQMSSPVELKLSVRLEGNPGKPLSIGLLFLVNVENPEALSFLEPQPDGSYAPQRLPPAKYRLHGAELDGYYMKRLLVSGEVVPNRTIDLRDGKPREVTMIISPNVARLSGKVTAKAEGVRSPRTVVLFDDTPNEEERAYPQQAHTDSQGEFHLDSLAPGRYRVFAFEEVDVEEWSNNPALAAKFADKSVAIELAEKEVKRVTLPLTASDDIAKARQ